MDKQVLASSSGMASTSRYAVGILKDGKHILLFLGSTWLNILTLIKAGRPLVDYSGRPFGTSLMTVVFSLVPIACSMLTLVKRRVTPVTQVALFRATCIHFSFE